MRQLLDNVMWNCLSGPHAKFATGESFYFDIWPGSAPAGWRIEKDARMYKMIWEAPPSADDAAPDAVLLEPQHYEQAVELAKLTNPGPFGPRTPELGEYFGYFEGTRLIAMAGERMCAGDLHEISGICTHPDFQGRGLARKLTLKLARRQMQRGKTPFLHVMSHNTVAQRLYDRMGFCICRETLVRVAMRVF